MRNWIAAALAAGMATSAFAQVDRPGGLGISLGAYFPVDSQVRGAFGNPIIDFGIGGADTNLQPNKLRFGFNIVSGRKDGNALFLLPMVAQYTFMLKNDDPYSDSDDGFKPYVKVFGGPAYYDYALDVSDTERKARKTIGINAGAELGVVLGSRWNIHARYNYFSESDGLDFSGLSLGASYLVYRF